MPAKNEDLPSTLERSPRSRMSKEQLADALQHYNDRATARERG